MSSSICRSWLIIYLSLCSSLILHEGLPRVHLFRTVKGFVRPSRVKLRRGLVAYPLAVREIQGMVWLSLQKGSGGSVVVVPSSFPFPGGEAGGQILKRQVIP